MIWNQFSCFMFISEYLNTDSLNMRKLNIEQIVSGSSRLAKNFVMIMHTLVFTPIPSIGIHNMTKDFPKKHSCVCM